jgi:hypothetical protein
MLYVQNNTNTNNKIDRKTRKILTMYEILHHKADTDKLYVKGIERGRSLLQIKAACKAEIINIAEYLNTYCKGDQFVNIAKSHGSIQPNMNSTIKIAAKIIEELSQMRTVMQNRMEFNTQRQDWESP